MAENFSSRAEEFRVIYDRERNRIPVRELCPKEDRHFQWEGWNEQFKLPERWLEHYASTFHFTDDELLAARKTTDMPRASGVYFLFSGDRCFYVGQTQNFVERSEQHKRNGLEWTSHSYIEVPKFHAKAVEAYYIRRMRPALNADYPKLRTYSDMVDILGLDAAM